MRWTLSPASHFSVIALRYAAAVPRDRGAEPGNTMAAFDDEPANTLAAFALARRSYRLTVSRRTPVLASIRRELQSRARSTVTCCCFGIFR